MSGNKRKALVASAALVVVVAGLYAWFVATPRLHPPALSAHVEAGTIHVGDRDRTYLAYVPASLPKGSPLVIVLHGSTMNAKQMRKWTGFEFDRLADEHHFAVVYPDGYKGNWNDCRRTAPFPAKKENIDDMGFMRALIDRFVSEQGVARDQVFAFGYSNGGQMAYRLAFEPPREKPLVAAIVAVSANFSVAENNTCPTEGPVAPTMLINGTDDPIMPFHGGEATLFGFASRGFVISSEATAELLAKRDNFTTAPVVTTLPHLNEGDPTSVERRLWSRDRHPIVDQYIVHSGGHTIPQASFRLPRMLGHTAHDLDSPSRAVAFFLSPTTLE